MPKHNITPRSRRTSAVNPYPPSNESAPRHAAIWSTADDEALLQARASGLNWQPISLKFPTKSANACRKRHERLVEKRNAEDWDSKKLEVLAQEYLAVRREMWEMLASRLGERWAVVEAKCMEKGLKTIQATARTAQRKFTAGPGGPLDEQGTADHHSDSGIGMGSDAEVELGEDAGPSREANPWQPETSVQTTVHQDHTRSRSLPQPLRLYQPPAPIVVSRVSYNAPVVTSPDVVDYRRLTTYSRYSPDSQSGRAGISIQSVLSPVEPQSTS